MMENQENQAKNNENEVIENKVNPVENTHEVVLNTSTEHTSSNVSIEQTAKEVREKREKNKALRIILFSVIGAIILLVALFLVLSHFSKMKEYVYNKEYPMYQYFSGVKSTYNGNVTLTNDGDITTIENKDGVSNIEDAPIYFQDVDNEVLITKSMQLVIPRLTDKNYKLKYFTKLLYDKDSNLIYYEDGKNKVHIEDSFLYDGDNLYLFLTDISVSINDKTYDLSPLSYIIVNYRDQIEIYNKYSDEYHVIDAYDKDVVVNLNDYMINLSTDMVSYGTDSRLLIKSVDNLDVYKNGE